VHDFAPEAEKYLAIDWTEEPHSEREAKVRAAILRRQLAELSDDPFGAAMRLREKMGFRGANECATDIREAWETVSERCSVLRRERHLKEIQQAIDDIDT
jgi:hypothetical protein